MASHSLRSVRLGAGAQSRKSLNAATSTQCVRDRMRVDASLVGWWSCNSSSPCFLLAFHFLPKPRTRVSKPRWSFIIIYNSDRISDWAACSIWPARAGQPGLSSVSLPGNRFPAPPPSVLSRVFETDHIPLNPKNIKCRDWHMTLGCGLSLCCDLNEIRVFWHFTSFPNRVPACPSQDVPWRLVSL